jgi:membrane associated rhomboid family serine protease
MLLPIRTSISPRKTPYANYALIVINVAVFVLSSRLAVDPQSRKTVIILLPWAEQFLLTPVRLYHWQFVTYAFLHSGFMHILGNMYFLYIFGNNVNDRLGNIGYICFYLAGAVFSGIGHTILHVNPVLGASGAVAAVTGAYLVLFPKSVIIVLYWLFFIGTMELSALYFIAFKLIFWDNVFMPRFSEYAIAYDAHLAGYAFGIAAILTLLVTKLVGRDQSDLLFMIKQWKRRRRFRDVVAEGYDPFKGRGPSAKGVKSEVTAAQQEQNEKIMQLRAKIAEFINQKNLPAAADIYLEILAIDSQHVLPYQHQLDIANQLMSASNWSASAGAYEKFLAHYQSYQHAEQVCLMLGILYSRYLDMPDKAVKCLKIAKDKLTDPEQLKLCDDELARIKN